MVFVKSRPTLEDKGSVSSAPVCAHAHTHTHENNSNHLNYLYTYKIMSDFLKTIEERDYSKPS